VAVTLRQGVLTVDDQGPGINEADLPMVFERFYRAEEARTMSGSGLGLSIVRQAAERHGGSVTASNRPGGGASFVLRLPGRSDPAQLPPPPGPAPGHDATGSGGVRPEDSQGALRRV